MQTSIAAKSCLGDGLFLNMYDVLSETRKIFYYKQ